ncbi:MAG TPA: PAS domain S-box protein [Candidatus Cloacimonadota bacterium]|nr:PAS domain S-box protein [Candidatus Cloacimonadota bacterium]
MEKKISDFYQKLFEYSSTPLIISDPKTCEIIDVNNAACKFYGYQKEELIGMQLSDIDSMTDCGIPSDQMKSGSVQMKYHRQKDGTSIPVETSVTDIHFDDSYYRAYSVRSVTDILNMNDSYNRSLFDESPVSLWVEDFSQVYEYLQKFKDKGIHDFHHYLDEHPEITSDCIRLLRVIDVNHATLKMYRARNLKELIDNLHIVMQEDAILQVKETLIALFEGRKQFIQQGSNYRLNGERMDVSMSWMITGDHIDSYRSVIVSFLDMTEIKKVQSELAESEQLFKGVFQQSSEGIEIVDSEGCIIEWNTALEKLTGIMRSECLGKTYWEIEQKISAKDKEVQEDIERRGREFLSSLNNSDDFEIPQTWEYTWFTRDGQQKYIHITTFQIDTKRGRMLVFLFNDISAAKRSQLLTTSILEITKAVNSTPNLIELFRSIQHSLSKLINVDNFYIAFYNAEHNIITLPYHIDEIDDDASPIMADNLHSLTAQVIRAEEPMLLSQHEIEERTNRGESIGISAKVWVGVPLKIDNTVIGAVAVQSYHNPNQYTYQDMKLLESVSEQIAIAIQKKKVEEEINILAQGIEQSAEGVVIMNTSGIIEYLNASYEKMSGYNREELVGKNISEVPNILRPGEKEGSFWDVVLNGEIWKGKISNIHKEGKIYTMDVIVSPIMNEEGKVISLVAGCHDITQDLEREQRMRQMQKLESLGTFASGIAHDFNNILSAIIGYTELALDDTPENTLASSNLNEVLHSANRAKEVIHQIMGYSRSEDSKAVVISLQDHVKEAMKLLRAIIPKTISIREKYSSCEDRIMAVPGQINQIIMNLGTNAAHAMKHKSGTINVEIQAWDIDAETMKSYPELVSEYCYALIFTDTGSGIPQSVIEKIFDPYFTTKPPSEGNGLGLSNVNNIIRSHSGSIRVDSVEGKGTTFTLLFPRLEVSIVSDIPIAPDQEVKGSERVLFIDDEAYLVNIAEQYLTRQGYLINGYSDSLEAWEKFAEKPTSFDLIVSDTSMPGMTGIEFSRKALQLRPDVKIVLVTGFSNIITAEQAKELGVTDFLLKPYKNKELAEMIRKTLDRENKE